MRSDMVPGAIFPDYELSDHTGKHRKLSEMQGQHPMVLVLSRGGYCPKDRRQAEGLIQLHREIEVGYCRLVTISTDNITETNEYRGGVGAHWPFLSDVRRIVQKDLDIAEYTDPLHNPMILERTGPFRSAVPIDPDQWFRLIPIADSGRSRSVCGEV
jgi:peroxiredoxin